MASHSFTPIVLLDATMSNPKDSEDVLSLLDALGDAAPPPATETAHDAPNENEKELLGFLDDLAKQPSRSQTPRPAATRSSRESARSINAPAKKSETVVEKPTSNAVAPSAGESGGGWLGGLWSMGSAAMKTAEQKVKELQQTDEAKAWEEKVRGNVSVLGKLGMMDTMLLTTGTDLRSRTMPSLSSTLTSVLNTIAPPIEKHEGTTLMIWLSIVLKVGIYHDMVGYPHIDKIVYDVFDKVMGQVEGGSLVVQKGREGKPRTTTSIQTRDLNICEGLDEAIKLAKVYTPPPY